MFIAFRLRCSLPKWIHGFKRTKIHLYIMISSSSSWDDLSKNVFLISFVIIGLENEMWACRRPFVRVCGSLLLLEIHQLWLLNRVISHQAPCVCRQQQRLDVTLQISWKIWIILAITHPHPGTTPCSSAGAAAADTCGGRPPGRGLHFHLPDYNEKWSKCDSAHICG